MSVDPAQWVSRWKRQNDPQEGQPVTDIPLTPTAVLPPLPWFLGEPPTYPEATALLEAARTAYLRLTDYGRVPMADGPLRIQKPLRIQAWGESRAAPHVQAGLGVWWQAKLVLLATGDGEVWAYHAGTAWEDALRALAT